MRIRMLLAAGAAALTAVGAVSCGADSGREGETSSTQQTLINPGGTVLPPTLQRPEVGKYGGPNGGVGCTATLIHNRFVLLAMHCIGYPTVLARNTKVTFTLGDGTQLQYSIDKAWIHKQHLSPDAPDFDRFDTQANLNSDLFIGRLSTQADARLTPAVLADHLPADGTAVRIFGYGGFGADTCTSNPDGNKRTRTFSWGPPLYPVCNGDSGGPTFDSSSFTSSVMAVTGSEGGLGSVVHFRERIYDEMRKLIDWPNAPKRWLVGTSREGNVVATLQNITTPAACETECIKSSGCASWSLTGTTCTLATEAGRWVPNANATSGIRPRIEAGQDRSAGALLATVPAISPTHCASNCGLSSSCFSWVYKGTDPQTACNLYSTVADPVGNSSAASGVKTGEFGVDRKFSAFEPIVQQPSDEACQNACAATWQCQAYTWNVTDHLCYMRYTFGKTVNALGLISNYKHSLPLTNVVLEGTLIRDWYVPARRFEEACRADCAQDASCVGFSVFEPGYGDPLRCRLLSSVTQERPFDRITSGYRGLTFF